VRECLNVGTIATEHTDHTIVNALMTAIWSHGQIHPDIEYFYPPDEIKYHGNNRGVISVNFFGSYILCVAKES